MQSLKMLIPSCCILSCLPERDLPGLWAVEMLCRVQGKGSEHSTGQGLHTKSPTSSELHPWAAQEENSQLCPGPQSTDRGFGISVPAPPRRAKHNPPHPAEQPQSGNHSVVCLEGTSQLISPLPLPWIYFRSFIFLPLDQLAPVPSHFSSIK